MKQSIKGGAIKAMMEHLESSSNILVSIMIKEDEIIKVG